MAPNEKQQKFFMDDGDLNIGDLNIGRSEDFRSRTAHDFTASELDLVEPGKGVEPLACCLHGRKVACRQLLPRAESCR
jgi:hypothetical protein